MKGSYDARYKPTLCDTRYIFAKSVPIILKNDKANVFSIYHIKFKTFPESLYIVMSYPNVLKILKHYYFCCYYYLTILLLSSYNFIGILLKFDTQYLYLIKLCTAFKMLSMGYM